MSNILVVEDEPLIGMMLEDWLMEAGHTTLGPAQSVAMALSVLDSSKVDAAILDLTLGHENGYTVAEALIAKGIPFAFATGHGAQSIRPEFRHILMLSKPFDHATVMRLLDTLLGGGASA